MDKAKRVNEHAERITELMGEIDQDCIKLAEAKAYIEQNAMPASRVSNFRLQDDLLLDDGLSRAYDTVRKRKQSLRFHVAELLSLVDMPEEYYYLMGQVEKYK